jgi:hypothetical protein
MAAITALILTSATVALAQKAEFSADMRLLDGTGRTEVVKLYVGNQRARLDRATTAAESNGINSLIIDFYHQMLFLLVPQAKVYLRIAGSAGTPFYQAAWMFRPASPDQPCSQWVAEADRRRITLRCQRAGEDSVDGRTTQKWEATSPQGAHGYLSYDANLNFVVRVMRTSKEGVQSGYELQNIKQGTQPPGLFDPYADYHEFSINRLLDALTAVGQW